MLFCRSSHFTSRTNTKVLEDNTSLLCCRGSPLLASRRVADIPAVRYQVPPIATWPTMTLSRRTCGKGSQPACASETGAPISTSRLKGTHVFIHSAAVPLQRTPQQCQGRCMPHGIRLDANSQCVNLIHAVNMVQGPAASTGSVSFTRSHLDGADLRWSMLISQRWSILIS